MITSAALVRCRSGLNLLQADRTLRSLRRAPEQIAAWLSQVLDTVRESADMLVIDSPAQALAPAATARDLILVAGPDAQSLTHSYRTLKRLAADTDRRRAFVLVNRAPSAAHARRIFGNLARTAGESWASPWKTWAGCRMMNAYGRPRRPASRCSTCFRTRRWRGRCASAHGTCMARGRAGRARWNRSHKG